MFTTMNDIFRCILSRLCTLAPRYSGAPLIMCGLLFLTACCRLPLGNSPAVQSEATSSPVATPALSTAVSTRSPEPSPLLPTIAALDVPALQIGSAPPTPDVAAPISDAAPADPVRIVIEAINLDSRLINVGLDENRIPIVPPHDPGWYRLSARPGQGENIVVWGHVLRFRNAPDIPAPFARLREVPIGATITLSTAQGTSYRYTVTDQIWATPDQVQYILPQGQELLTLVSCIGEQVVVNDTLQMTHRLITIAYPAS